MGELGIAIFLLTCFANTGWGQAEDGQPFFDKDMYAWKNWWNKNKAAFRFK